MTSKQRFNPYLRSLLIVIPFAIAAICKSCSSGTQTHTDSNSTPQSGATQAYSDTLLTVNEISTKYGELLCFQPDMSSLNIDLVCDSIPNPDDGSIIMAFAGAFTGTMWDKKHGNVAGDHVSRGTRYKGYRCKRNTGAFTWSAASGPQFYYRDYTSALDRAAAEGGMGFTQEMMIHKGKQVPTTRPLKNKNQFRALCLMTDGELAIIESQDTITFGDFINALLDAGASEALYTDMGPGWNYCFYRRQIDAPATFLHNKPIAEASNFVVITN